MKRQRVRKGLILISFLLFPVVLNYMSPYLVIQGASEGILTGSFLFFSGLFVASLFLGRAFCGWLCPGAGLQESCFAVNSRYVTRGNWVKYVLWVPWVLAIAFTVSRSGFRGIDPMYQTEYGISVTDPINYVIYYFVMGLLVILAFAVGKRSFCHQVCWMAPFMVLGRKASNLLRTPALRLKVQKDVCTKCGLCTKACPMSLPVQDMVAKGAMENSECILCGNCVDTCPRRAIRYTWQSEPISASSSQMIKNTSLG